MHFDRKRFLSTMLLMLSCSGLCGLQAQERLARRPVLHMQQSVKSTDLNPYNPVLLKMYQVLDGANSTAQARALSGTISLQNTTADFSQVLMIVANWQGQCPANDENLTTASSFLWSDILKNPSQSTVTLGVDVHFPSALPMTGCVGLYFGGGSEFGSGVVTMSADLNLTYEPVDSNANTVIDVSGEYCFGETTVGDPASGVTVPCGQNSTADDTQVFAVPTTLPAGHIAEIFGDISDSTLDGTPNFGPLPTGDAWAASNDFYLLPGGCGAFGQNLNGQMFPNPLPLATFQSWLPGNALRLESVPQVQRIAPGTAAKAALQRRVEDIFSVPVAVNAGDCMLVVYGKTGNGASDHETQVKLVVTP